MTQSRRPAGGSAALPARAAALAGQLDGVRRWLESAPIEHFSAPSVLAGPDVGQVVTHLVLMQRQFLANVGAAATARPAEPVIPLAEYLRVDGGGAFRCGFLDGAAEPGPSWDERTREAAIAELGRLAEQVTEAVEGRSPQAVISAGKASVRLDDWLTLGLLDVVLHADDVNRSLEAIDGASGGAATGATDGAAEGAAGETRAVALLRPALAAVVRALAQTLAAQAPGRSVEVRVPPFVAIQAIAGPRHTRGTPPNVIELSAADWLRLATGRYEWQFLIGMKKISASGLRASLEEYVPLLG